MTQQEFMTSIVKLYRVANRSDAREVALEHGEHWSDPQMAGPSCCQHLDRMLHDLVQTGVITSTQHQYMLDSI